MTNAKRFLALLALSTLPLTSAWSHPPRWAPGYSVHAHRHHYVYYPARQIYWAPDRGVWFWLDGGSWRMGATLPAPYARFVVDGIYIDLGTARPYEDHRYVIERYGPSDRPRHFDDRRHDRRGDRDWRNDVHHGRHH